MMLEEQLRKFQLFNYGGVYSVKKKTKDIIESLQYTIELLKDSANMALLFPQGEIQSQHLQQLHFQKGLAYLIKHTATGYHIVFTASLTDYFSNRKPSLHIFYEEYTINRSAELITIENAYNNFYSNCKLTLQNMHTTN